MKRKLFEFFDQCFWLVRLVMAFGAVGILFTFFLLSLLVMFGGMPETQGPLIFAIGVMGMLLLKVIPVLLIKSLLRHEPVYNWRLAKFWALLWGSLAVLCALIIWQNPEMWVELWLYPILFAYLDFGVQIVLRGVADFRRWRESRRPS